MLFTSPAFMFLFFPLSLLFLLIFGKKRKKPFLAIICATFQLMLNINSPINLVWIPLLAVFSYFAARLSELRRAKWLNIILGAVPIAWLIVMRQLAYMEVGSPVYPMGMTLPTLCAAAYVWDASLEEGGERRKFFDLWLYLSFFPIMFVGPFVGYSGFMRMTDDSNMEITLERCAEGLSLFATGFIKRIAVGAVLIDGYNKIFAYSWENPSFTITLLLVVLIYFGVFFALSGYYDMAVGISKVYGAELPEVYANPLSVATIAEYSQALFGHLKIWADRYLLREGSAVSRIPALRIAVYCISAVLLVRTQPFVLLLCIPLVLVALAFSWFKLEKNRSVGRTGLRTLSGFALVVLLGVFWMFIAVGEGTPLEYINGITFDNAEYQTDMVLVSFSIVKYLCVILVGVVTLLPRTRWVLRLYDNATERARTVTQSVYLVIILALFLLSILFFLPQFEQYSYAAFEYILL